MKSKMSNSMGDIVIDTAVISKYAGLCAIECFGIVGMAGISVKDGFVKLLKKDSLTRGINVTLHEDNTISIDFHVIISYGVSIKTVTENLMESVHYKVEEYTGIKIKKINVYVDGVRVID